MSAAGWLVMVAFVASLAVAGIVPMPQKPKLSERDQVMMLGAVVLAVLWVGMKAGELRGWVRARMAFRGEFP